MNIEIEDVGRMGETYVFRTFQKMFLHAIRTGKTRLLIELLRQVGKTDIFTRVIKDFMFNFPRPNPVGIIVMQSHENAYDVYFRRLFEEQLAGLPKHMIEKRGTPGKSRIDIKFKRPWLGDVVKMGILGCGARGNVRGGTVDIALLDEVAFYPPDFISSVVTPMTDETDGLLLQTSTPNKQGDHWERLKTGYKELVKLYPKKYFLHIEDIIQTDARSEKWKKEKIAEFEALGEEEALQREYFLIPYEGPEGAKPFNKMLNDAASAGKSKVCNFTYDPAEYYVNLNIDIGLRGKMPIWAWIKPRHGPPVLCVDYYDKCGSLAELPLLIKERYVKYKRVNVIFPHDANVSSVDTGMRRIDQFNKEIRNLGLNLKVFSDYLPKTRNKIGYSMEAIENFHHIHFEANNCVKGLRALRGVEWKITQTTQIVNFGVLQNNKHAHCGDAMIYMCHSLDHNLTKDLEVLLGDEKDPIGRIKLRYSLKSRKN